ncbi:uncharacterized protein KY384_005424 [Bacidia gigantensis]|uniref:uncharacterized protein n=1 Tax=Bacidia gigantensis TaxID=2732470 RepID=UPI001D04EC99|nr:uncharacterized protein KY384_005424 [Bacidia gigantensis]KAG8529943.1 hypothetical protein KY384_005424 [Bacidia gigantensis]
MLHAMSQPVPVATYNNPPKLQSVVTIAPVPTMSLDQLQNEVQHAFEDHLTVDSLLFTSRLLQAEFREHLISSDQRMLPSFNYTLPTGEERGTYLAVEVGGSNLRMALVDLHGRDHGQAALQIRRTACSPITGEVKLLPGHSFFDWMAREIQNMMVLEGETRENADPLRMGVACQTSIRSGNVLGMGKGFLCSDTVKNHDLGHMISEACQREHVNVELEAIVNDTSSALLARAYVDPATRLAIVLGTGMNAAIHLPISGLDPSKFDLRQVKPKRKYTHVLTNTELSMFGKNILPTTKWDDDLNVNHMMPDYQPLEYLIAGGYLGEIVRLVMVEAADTSGFYGGKLPDSLLVTHSLDTKTLASVQSDTSVGLMTTRNLLQEKYASRTRPSAADAKFLRNVVQSVSRRSVAYFATSVHALTSLLQDLDAESGLQSPLDHISIGCDGSVINKYPAYMETAQETLDQMRVQESTNRKQVFLEKTTDSAVVGAGVAGALAGNSPPSSPC